MTARLRRVRPSRGALAEGLLVVVGYLLVAVYATWPLARGPFSGFYGFGNDNLGGIWVYGALHDAYTGPASAARSPELQAPFGYVMPDQVLQPMDRLYSLLFGGFGQGLGAYNAQIFLSFVFAGCTMYLLVRYLTGNRAASWVAGFAFTYSPWHLALAMQYNSLAAIEWIPLFVLAFLVFLRRGRKRDAALTGVAFALVAATSYYYAWFTAWIALITALLFVMLLAVRRRRSEGLSVGDALRFIRFAAVRVGVAAIVALAILVPLVLPTVTAAQDPDVAATTTHSVAEAVRYSMRPWMLVLPPHDNPFVDGRLEREVMSRLYDQPVYEGSIYLGWAVILLAGVALWRARSRRLAPLTPAAASARPVLLAGAVVGLLVMLGPYIPLEGDYWRRWAEVDRTSHLPSIGSLMFDVTASFRFFVRAFVVVSACAAALAGIGLARLSPLTRGRRVPGIAVAALATAVIGLEFTNAPPHVFTSTSAPPWVRAVGALPGPDAPIVNYPVVPLNSPRSLYYIFWQREHGKPTVNPPVTRAAEALAAEIAVPDRPDSGRALHNAGIRYAVVHTALPPLTTPPYQPRLPGDALPADTGSQNPWFDRVAVTRDAVIYRVRSTPRPGSALVARTAGGFGAREPEVGTTAQWLEAPEGAIAVYGADGRPLRLTFEVGSFGQPRDVEVLVDGAPLRTIRVPVRMTRVTLDLGPLPAGDHAVTLRTSPGPQLIGNGDARTVSIRIRRVDVRAVAP